VARVGADETAFGDRTSPFAFNVAAAWRDPALTGEAIGWSRRVVEDLERYGTGGSYLNVQADAGEDIVRAAFGSRYERLAAVKARYDPDNVFRLNQNIRPAAQPSLP
jgi:FAD/FMN-containing dehydrogenase